MAFGEVSDGRDVLGRDADVDELRQEVTPLGQDAKGAVAGADDLDGGFDDVAQHVRQRQVGVDAEHRVEEIPKPVRVVHPEWAHIRAPRRRGYSAQIDMLT